METSLLNGNELSVLNRSFMPGSSARPDPTSRAPDRHSFWLDYALEVEKDAVCGSSTNPEIIGIVAVKNILRSCDRQIETPAD
jgi:hypothetical protein